jgi:hypothetical protein
LKILHLSFVFDVQKGKFLAAEKFALLPALKCCLGEALLAASARFLECRSGKSGQPFYKPVDLDVAAFGWAAAAAKHSVLTSSFLRAGSSAVSPLDNLNTA